MRATPGPPRAHGVCTLVAAGMLLAGCRTAPPGVAAGVATAPGEVAVAVMAPAPGTSRLALPRNQAFVFPNLVAPVVLPAYPPGLLGRRLPPTEVCVDVDIDATGLVSGARLREDAACDRHGATGGAAMADAALRAVRRWRYDPALLCIAPEPTEDPCWHPGAEERATPIRMSYMFRFSQHDGVPVVEMGPGG